MNARPCRNERSLYEKHGAPTRVLHWINLIAMAVLIVTGCVIWGDREGRSATVLHLSFAFALVIAGTAYALALAVSGGWRTFLPTRAALEDAAAVVRSELGAGAHVPSLVKYNGAQRLAYGAAILMAAAEVLTGCALFFQHQAPWLAAALGGRHAVTTLHIALMFGILAFALVHVAQVLRAGLPVLLGMIGGAEPTKGNATFDGSALADQRRVRNLTEAEAAQEPVARTRRGFLVTASTMAAAAALALVGSHVTGTLHRRGGDASGEVDDVDDGGETAAPGSRAWENDDDRR